MRREGLNGSKVGICLSGNLAGPAAVVWLAQTRPAQGFIADLGQASSHRLTRSLHDHGLPTEVIDLREAVAGCALDLTKYGTQYEGGNWKTISAGRWVLVADLAPLLAKAGCQLLALGIVDGGNDQQWFTRYTVCYGSSVAPLPIWTLEDLADAFPGRRDMLDFVTAAGLTPLSAETVHSEDVKLAGASLEGVALEGRATPSTEAIRHFGDGPLTAPDKPETVMLRVEQVRRVSVNDAGRPDAAVLTAANEIGAVHGLGLCNVVENRINGTECRVDEAPRLDLLGTARLRGRQLSRIDRGENEEADRARVKRRYLDTLRRSNCGINLERPPANWIVTPGPLPLEDVYEPLLLHTETPPVQADRAQLESLGQVLSRFRHVTIIGTPGAGKTTLTKRIAAAYADGSANVNDGLPDLPLCPVVLKCRSLTDVTRPLMSILSEIVNQTAAGPLPAAESLLATELETGRLLLLVDGIDEIPSIDDRLIFTERLRQFAYLYRGTRVVLTADSSCLEQIRPGVAWTAIARIQELSDTAIESLVRKWHHHVMGPSAEASLTAKRLTASILESSTLRTLATNPLLLNLLLIVQRSAKGRTPDGRTALYTEAVRELLAMWNIGGNCRLRLTAARAQLAYVAYQMTVQGKSDVTDEELTRLIEAARTAIPQLRLAGCMSIAEFVDRIGRNTGLLHRTRTTTYDGHVVLGYEFNHVSFQRYLAATAVAHVWVRASLDGLHLSDLWNVD